MHKPGSSANHRMVPGARRNGITGVTWAPMFRCAFLSRVLRRFSCNLTAPDTPLRVDAGSDVCVRAGLVDEWLQARDELRIEIFLRRTRFGRSPRLLRLKTSATASSGGNRAHRGLRASPSLRGQAG